MIKIKNITSLIHKTANKKTLQGKLFIKPFLCINGGNIYLDRDMKQPGISDHFPEGTGFTSWFFILSAGSKLKGAFRISSPNSKRIEDEKIK